jgi:hypothetical protein
MVTQEFRDNRQRFSLEGIKAHQGECIAFNAEGTRIVASAATYGELEARLGAMGIDGQTVAFEGVPGPDDGANIGFAETVFLGEDSQELNDID